MIVLALASREWIERPENVIALGRLGSGKPMSRPGWALPPFKKSCQWPLEQRQNSSMN
jgi:hypothetical protein